MKTKQKKYLALYKKWLETGKLPKGLGLCNEFGKFDSTKGVRVYHDELFPLFVEDQVFVYWGFEDGFGEKELLANWGNESVMTEMRSSFTPLRQTILLFMAALNEEL